MSEISRDVIETLTPEPLTDEETGAAVGNTKHQPQNQLTRWFMTWNNYEEGDIEMLYNKMILLCKKFVFQTEIGELCGTPHIQGVFVLNKRMRWSEFNLPKKIHWAKVINEEKCFRYCSKMETYSGIRKCFNYVVPKYKRPLVLITELRPWQTEINTMISNYCTPMDRKILWIYDRHGLNGKTQYCKFAFVKVPNTILMLSGGQRDIMNIINKWMDDNKDCEPEVFLFNIARSARVNYSLIENLKDGIIFSTKYEGGIKVINTPHVIVCCNQLPIFNKLSKDKWDIRTIDDQYRLVDYNKNIVYATIDYND